MASTNSFDAQGTLEVGEQSYEIYRLAAVEGQRDACPTASRCSLENLLRTEDGANITADHIRALGGVGRERPARHRDPVHAGARDHAGLHRRALRRRPRHDARGRRRPRRRRRPRSTRWPPPSWSSTTRCIIDVFGRADAFERNVEHRVRAQPASATSSCAGARPRSTTSRSSRRAPASCTRSTSSTSPAPSWSATASAYPDTCVGTDSPHDDGQRPRRARLGRRRHRGRGGHARPARLDAHPARRRLQAHRRRSRRAPPRPTSCSRSPRCCASTASSASSSSSTARASPPCRWPTAPRSAT